MCMISADEAGELLGIKNQAVRRRVSKGQLKCEIVKNGRNKDKYMIHVESLPLEAQKKYHERQNATKQKQASKVPLDGYSQKERDEVSKWIGILMRWQEFRNSRKSKCDADEIFIAGMELEGLHLSTGILYRKWKAYKADDLNGLLDNRGQSRRGKSSIDDEVWRIFNSFYLDERRISIKKCHEHTISWLKDNRPELVDGVPDYTTFTRHVKKLPVAVELLGRDGEKAFHDNCAPHIRRTYDGMESNDYWVGDTHTLDIISEDQEGVLHRLYLTAFFDARSGIFTGRHIATSPSSQDTLIALRKGIIKYGIPKNIYVDNGREYLTFDLGGLGHRQKKSTKDRFDPPPIFERLGITMVNAIVRNARAKIIERRFVDVKNGFSKLFESYTGGSVAEKPESLKFVLKKGQAANDHEVIEMIETIIEGYFNFQTYHGGVTADHGKRRIDIYNENMLSKRIATEADLNLMLMRSTRAQKVGRRGVHIKIGGQRIDYWNQELLVNLLGQQVYLRYDPDDLSKVRLYDLEDRYIMDVEAENETILEYGASKEDIKTAMSKIRRIEKAQKQVKDEYIHPEINRRTALDLVIAESLRNKESAVAPVPDNMEIEVQRADEKPLLHDITKASIDRMLENARKNNMEN